MPGREPGRELADPPIDDLLGPEGPEGAAASEQRIAEIAAQFVAAVIDAPADSPAFRRSVTSIERLGEREIQTTAAIASRFGDRPTRTIERELEDRQGLARNQRRLRHVIEGLTALAARPGTTLARLAQALSAAQPEITALVGAIDAERQTLEVDNGQIGQQERALWTEIVAIRECVAIAARIDAELDTRLEVVRAADPQRGRLLHDELLVATRQRRRELLLQLAVATQGYAALRRIEQGNLELIWLIRATTSSTLAALRTAVLLANDADGGDDAAAGVRAAWLEVIGALDQVDVRRRRALAEVGRPA